MCAATEGQATTPVTPNKTVLVAHRSPVVRGRFAAALEVARHRFVPAESEAAALDAAGHREHPPSLAVVDLGLAADGLAFLRELRARAPQPMALVVFAGSVESATLVPELAALGVHYLNEHVAPAQILPSLAPHLFPDNFNRRTSARVRIGIPVSYRVGTTTAGATTIDIGPGGLAVRTLSPLAPGTTVQLRFRLPGSADDVEATGQVVWSDPRVGMGIEFARLSPAEQERLNTFVAREPHA